MSLLPDEMRQLASAKFGAAKWLQGLARATSVSERMIRRWEDGSIPINGRIESLIRRVCDRGSVA